MANIVGDVAIQVGADIAPLVRELDKAKGKVTGFSADVGKSGTSLAGMTKAAGIAAAAVVAAGTALAAFTKHAMDNIDAQSKQARAIGISVASFQAMAMVAGEAGVETDALSKILIKMQDNISSLGKGTAAQVSAFGRLGISMSDLAGLGADEQFALLAENLSAIEDPATKTAAVLDIFGKSGADAITMLDGYAGAVSNAAKFQAEFGIAVSDLDAQNIEAANDAMGRMGMAITGVGNVLATIAAPAIITFSEAVVGLISNALSAEKVLGEMFGSIERAQSILGEDVFASLIQSKSDVEAASEVVKDLIYNWEDLSRQVNASVSAISGDIATLIDAGMTDLALQLDDVVTEMERLRDGFETGTVSADEFKSGMERATAEAKRLLEEAGKIGGIDVSGAVGSVNLLTRALGIAASVAASLRANLPGGGGATVEDDERGGNTGNVANAYTGTGLAPRTSIRPPAAPNNIDGGYFPPDLGGGGGGGGGESLADRLEKLREEFGSEAEVLQEQYDAKLLQLEEFRDAKLISEQEYNDLELQLSQDHQAKMKGIEGDALRERLQAYAGMFGDLSSLMSSENDKLFKIGQAAAIAEATVNGIAAAVAAHKKGMIIGGPAVAAAFAAASLAKTGAMISSIASQSSRGGSASAGGGGGTGGATAVAAAEPQRVANLYIQGDRFGADAIESIADGLNDWIGDGGVLNVRRG